jgi:DNA polymerase-1
MPLTPQTCYGNVRILDAPCLPNVARLDHNCLRMVHRFHRHGTQLDTTLLSTLTQEFTQRMDSIRARIKDLCGVEVNPNSGDQLALLLFEQLGLVPKGGKRKTPTGRDVMDSDTLAGLKDSHPVIPLVEEYRQLDKLRGTYSAKLPGMVDRETGRLHTTFRHTNTNTGRLSSEAPNLQNIPARTRDGMRIREAFVAGRDRLGRQCVLGACDLSQIEMMLAGDLSQDHMMLQAFRDGLDIHTETAINVFELDRAVYRRLADLAKREEAGEEVVWGPGEKEEWKRFKQEIRLPSKTVGFAILYGQTAAGLQLNILGNGGPFLALEECEDLIRGWFRVYEGVRDWLELQHSRATRYGMVWDWFGRIKLTPEALSSLPRIRRGAYREAGNMPIQATAQGIIKLVMAEVMDLVEAYEDAYPDSRCWPVLQIHDELVFELSPDIAQEFLEDVRRVMVSAIRLCIPVGASAATGANWACLK